MQAAAGHVNGNPQILASLKILQSQFPLAHQRGCTEIKRTWNNSLIEAPEANSIWNCLAEDKIMNKNSYLGWKTLNTCTKGLWKQNKTTKSELLLLFRRKLAGRLKADLFNKMNKKQATYAQTKCILELLSLWQESHILHSATYTFLLSCYFNASNTHLSINIKTINGSKMNELLCAIISRENSIIFCRLFEKLLAQYPMSSAA